MSSKVYTQIGAGSYATRHLTQIANDAMRASAMGGVVSGALVQLNMGWSNAGKIDRRGADEILEQVPHHAYQEDPAFHTLVHEGTEYTMPAFPHIARSGIEQSDPDDLAGVFVDYEAFHTRNPPRFDVGHRPCTAEEIKLMAGCYATARWIAYQHTGRAVPVSCWNLPIRPLDDRNDWDGIVDGHRAMGSDFVILNGYKTSADYKSNYTYIRDSIRRYRHAFKSRGVAMNVVVALSLSTDGGAFDPINEASLVMKARAAFDEGADVLLWLNADWYQGANTTAIDTRFNILGGIFDEPIRTDSDHISTD